VASPSKERAPTILFSFMWFSPVLRGSSGARGRSAWGPQLHTATQRDRSPYPPLGQVRRTAL
jgi:hypothetical protein